MEGEGNSDVTEPGLQQDSWTSIDHQCIDGNQQGLVLEETVVLTNQELSTDQISPSLKTDRESPEEPEPWEQIIWPVQPMTCTSPLLSFATVQWDMPDPSAGAPSPVTHGSLANELDSVIMTSVGTTSPSPYPYEDVNDELFREEDRETEEELNSEPLSGNDLEPCDDVDVQEHAAQEEEDSAQEQLGSNNENVQEIFLRTDLKKDEKEEEEVKSASSDPIESLVIIDSLQEIESSGDEVESFVDLKLEEEREESVALLSRQGDSEEEETSLNGIETEKKDQEESKLEEDEEQGEVEEDKERDEAEEDVVKEDKEQDQLEEGKQREVEEEKERDKVEEDKESGEVEEDLEREEDVEQDELKEDEQRDEVEEGEEQHEVEEDKERHKVEEDEEGEKLNRCAGESEELEADGSLNHVEVPAEPQQTDEAGLTIIPDKLLALQPSEFSEEKGQSKAEKDTELQEEGPTGQTEELEMCRDVNQDLEPEQSEAADNTGELSTQAANNIERVEDTQELLELTERLQETSCQKTPSQDIEDSPQLKQAESEQLEMTEETEQVQKENSNSADKVEESEHLEQALMELADESTQTEKAEESTPSEQTPSAKAEDPVAAEQQEQTESSDQNEQRAAGEQLTQPEKTDESDIMEQLPPETGVTQQTVEAELSQTSHQAEEEEDEGVKDNVQTVVPNGVQHKCPDTAVPHMNGREVDRESARSLAERLFKLDGIQRVEVVRHLDKDNDFSRAVGEEYLKFFDFIGQTLDHALRSFLKVVVLIGETQERERVLQQFACRFHQCNPESFSSAGSVLALTCALMLLNTDLHGQNVGKSMSSSKFVSNLDGMNEEANFSKDFLKSLYNSIKSEPLEWAVDEEELKSSVLAEEDAGDDTLLRSKANPFQDVPHDKTATVIKQGFLQRKLHADIDGKRMPWGKRGWKTFYAVLKGMVLYLQKDDYRRDQLTNEEVVSVHHSLAEEAADYTKKPHVLRLQTADWRVFLFQASSRAEMNSWISRINLVSALHSSPPFPAAVGSQRRFCRPILPSSQSAHTLESQLQSHAKMLESFQADLSYQQQNPPEGKKVKAKELEEQRVRAEYLQHEICRYEIYIQVLEAWKKVKTTDGGMLTTADLNLFDRAVCSDSVGEVEEEGSLKKSYSSPSLELEIPAPTVIKVRRNISERRTYRRTIVPRWNKEA
ncbi:PH and SEC7 domain-containing protein 4 [Xyrichtys novacula]|uniref:PH and SEC7 domain-containing protein 4 n=1 Tax=Xyrichtys novacula TaxID=13765 RepID=A0AAV1GB90_XYRNO|nr:PH and SEC7 domain-containing protein 4 [Xyrichtys novacula]